MQRIQNFLLCSLITWPLWAHAEKLCDIDYSTKDPLHIKEEDLTRERYDEAIEFFRTINPKTFENYNEVGFGIVMVNHLRVINGYALKLKAQTDGSSDSRVWFCRWLDQVMWSD